MFQRIMRLFGYEKVKSLRSGPVFPLLSEKSFGMMHGPELDGYCGNSKCECRKWV